MVFFFQFENYSSKRKQNISWAENIIVIYWGAKHSTKCKDKKDTKMGEIQYPQ